MSDKIHIHFDLSLMGEADKRNLFSAVHNAVRRFYDDPANLEKYERWKQGKRSTTTRPTKKADA